MRNKTILQMRNVMIRKSAFELGLLPSFADHIKWRTWGTLPFTTLRTHTHTHTHAHTHTHTHKHAHTHTHMHTHTYTHAHTHTHTKTERWIARSSGKDVLLANWENNLFLSCFLSLMNTLCTESDKKHATCFTSKSFILDLQYEF